MDPTVVEIGDYLKMAAAYVEAVTKVERALDSDRTIILVVANGTDHMLQRRSYGFQHGNFKVPAPDQIPAQAAAVFGAVDTGFMTGVEGQIQWSLTDDQGETWFGMQFDDPYIGGNSGSAMAFDSHPVTIHVSGIGPIQVPVPSDRYYAVATIGGGNACQMNYVLRPGKDPARL